MAPPETIQQVEYDITGCTRCPRLAVYTRAVAVEKVKRFRDWSYWGKPVPGFGDPDPLVYILGLAPAAHGANRTGRMFTGDSSGDWLYKALYETGFASQPTSISADDGLMLHQVYIGATARCAPPANKPLPQEVANCTEYMIRELQLFPKLKVVLCLGAIAFNHYCKLHGIKGLKFGHLASYTLPNGITLISSYHPSRQNTQTGLLKWDQWLEVFRVLREVVER